MAGKWANNTKNELQKVVINDGLVEFGGGGSKEAIKLYYKYNDKASSNPKYVYKRYVIDAEIAGTYEGSFKDNFDKDVYKIRTENEGLVALEGSARLSKLMAEAKIGGQVKIIYRGKEGFTDASGARKSVHAFIVRGEKA